jgi:hypothetical protein
LNLNVEEKSSRNISPIEVIDIQNGPPAVPKLVEAVEVFRAFRYKPATNNGDHVYYNPKDLKPKPVYRDKPEIKANNDHS